MGAFCQPPQSPLFLYSLSNRAIRFYFCPSVCLQHVLSRISIHLPSLLSFCSQLTFAHVFLHSVTAGARPTMLVSLYEMKVAAKTFPDLFPTSPSFETNERPVSVQLGFRLSSDFLDTVRYHSHSYIRASLSPRSLSRSSPDTDTVIDGLLGASHTVDLIPQSNQFVYFTYPFSIDEHYDIYINLSLINPTSPATSSIDSSSSSSPITHAPVSQPIVEPIGYIRTNFSSVCSGENETTRVDILNTQMSERPQTATAQLKILWPPIEEQLFLIDIRIKVQLSGGWPFSSRRPFFVLYRWENHLLEWTSYFRSEILTEPSPTPDAQGSMIFLPTAFILRKVIGQDEHRPLRFEFFHYKLSGEQILLAYCTTSLVELRQTTNGHRLHLVLNIFPKGELVGNLSISKKYLTASRYHFLLQANFGGPFRENFAYISINIANYHNRRFYNFWNEARPYFSIQRYTDNDVSEREEWDEVYRSEHIPFALSRRPQNYQIAKVTLRKLNNDEPHRKLSINICRRSHSRDSAVLAYFHTTVSELLEAPFDKKFPLRDGQNGGVSDHSCPGYAVLEAKERRDSKLSLCLGIVLGQSLPTDVNV